VSVIDTATNSYPVGSPINVGDFPTGVAVTPDGSRVYVTNLDGNTVSVIDTATNAIGRLPDRGRHWSRRRGGHAGRQQGLCRQLE
jgi:DNA-binding beta-propeller fold protein YncE